MAIAYRVVLIRYGEIGIKSNRTRSRYERILIENIKAMLELQGISYSNIEREWGRIYISTELDNAREIAKAASKVFGVTSTSPVVEIEPELESIARAASDIASELIQDGETFGIRARRAGVHSYTSREIAIKAGDAILTKLKHRNVKVDLNNPKHEIFIEARQNNAYIYTEIYQGTGGLPIGSQEKITALISGGIDSPVAAWLMMKRGCELIAIYFNNSPFTDETTRNRALACIAKLKQWCPGHELKTYEVPHGKNLEIFKAKAPKLTCVLCKRMMYRIAKEIALKEGALGIVTGSSLGQVASQTVSNLYVENHGLDFPLYHPLIGFDKMQIADLARKIGTFEISIQKAASCSAVPSYPITHAKLEDVLEVERQMDISSLVKASFESALIL
ncbi:MAG: tRNA uracil 4-sulfurtransferase ThiI [Methanocellales archaeon]